MFVYHDEDGQLVSQVMHAGDGRISRARHFHPGGGLMATGKYVGQQKDSTWSYYDVEGRLRRVEQFQGGELHGEQVSYYADGTPAERNTYHKGVLHGEHKSWFASGNLKSEFIYVDGEPDGAILFNHPNGRKESEGRMAKGQREGTWRYYNDDGSIRTQIVFRRGLVEKEKRDNGTFVDHYEDEKPRLEITYKKGVREGRFVEYHNNGKWLLKHKPADPVMGTPEDIERVLEGQIKSREGTYRNDLLEGEVKEYDERGKLVRTARYVAGQEVKK
jgi:antitoxin component YwqK of YwqJK toxin-antitoxin module